ncbi:hypothetical protein ACYFX5_03900 [Bremerella sp. T1]|uniref:hypothetical protein n=1 Tax=Bremerella sp. TYQ1 TaxID=3119568 RepID=UPI001CD018AB|nr:hypothetical protein [Bremerella volcania]UBM37413.1 hypothetical protein LA756_05855 [Bremerella volcania]
MARTQILLNRAVQAETGSTTHDLVPESDSEEPISLTVLAAVRRCGDQWENPKQNN